MTLQESELLGALKSLIKVIRYREHRGIPNQLTGYYDFKMARKIIQKFEKEQPKQNEHPIERDYLCSNCGKMHPLEISCPDKKIPIIKLTDNVQECFFHDGRTYDCNFPNGPIYCGKYNYKEIPKKCPLVARKMGGGAK